MKTRPFPKTERVSQRSASQRGTQQLDLLSGEEKQPTPTTTASYNVGKTELRLKPAPKNPQRALKRVLEEMGKLLQKRDEWLPTLETGADSTSFSLEGDVECVVYLLPPDQTAFVGVKHCGGALHFYFPSSDRWVDVGLA